MLLAILFPSLSAFLHTLPLFKFSGLSYFGLVGTASILALPWPSLVVAAVSALAAVTTTISAATGSVSALFTDMIINRRKTGEIEYDITMCMNGALSGLVAITAGCAVLSPWAAFVTGVIAGWVYIFFSKLLVRLRIDDAVDAIPGESTVIANRNQLLQNYLKAYRNILPP